MCKKNMYKKCVQKKMNTIFVDFAKKCPFLVSNVNFLC